MNNDYKERVPLFVDLDGTLIKTDTLYESFLVALKCNPFILFFCLYWLLKGRAYLKRKIALRASLSVKSLPLNREFYDFLVSEAEAGRKIVLATASDEIFAKEFVQCYGFLNSSIGSDGTINLKGSKKLKKIKATASNFAYAGNSAEDFILFRQAKESYLVNPKSRVERKASKYTFDGIFDHRDERKRLSVWLKQIRIHQWLKNTLLFVPLLVSGKYLDIKSLLFSLLGFFSFSLLASATYILNDLFDIEADRNHARKKFRPLASGEIDILTAVMMAFGLFVLSILSALLLPFNFTVFLFIYLSMTLFYSFTIKQYMGMDVITLASLYTIRVLAGSSLLMITPSFWLLAFSMFVFFSLALIKRCSELKSAENSNIDNPNRRDYSNSDYNVLLGLGTSSAMLSVLMLCFYIKSDTFFNQYQQPALFWVVFPALGYWLIRMWVKTNRGEMPDDPLLFTIKDRGSLITVAFIAVITIIARIL